VIGDGYLDPKERGPEGADDPGELARRWITEIRLAEKECKQWFDRGRKVVKRYVDERSSSEQTESRFNILWSNVSTLKPAIYARAPLPVAERRYRDQQDPVAKLAAELLQKVLRFQVDDGGFDHGLSQSIDDYLLPGRGQVWVRYEPTFDADDDGAVASDDMTQAQAQTAPEAAESVTWEQVCVDYVHWTDFLTSPARVWHEVRWVARRVFMTRDDLEDRFGAVGKDVPLDYTPSQIEDTAKTTPAYDSMKRAVVWEIWCKTSGRVYWIAPGYGTKPLDVRDPPLRLEGFWPCPRPLSATMTTDSTLPVPDYYLYQDQAAQLDEMTARINSLTKALKVAGAYDASADGLKRMLDEGVENQLIPVDSWAAFAEKGGLQGAISFLPIADTAQVLLGLTQAREVVKRDLYEITGISDIVRGQGMASETATAQRIKGNFATLRLDERKRETQRFARDVVRIMAEIVAEHFGPETLAMQAGMVQQVQADPQTFMAAVELLRSDKLRGFLVDIETDSTIAPDEQAEKEARVEFLQAAGGFLAQAIPAAQAAPQLTPMLMQMLLFGIRGFRAGREIEGVFEQAVQQAEQAMAQPPAEPQPDPAVMAEQQRLQAEMQTKQAELALKREEMAAKVGLEREKMALEVQKIEAELSLKREAMLSDTALKRETEQMRLADAASGRRETLEATKKPAAMIQVDAQGAMEQAAATLTQMAQDQSTALAQAVGAMQQSADGMAMAAQAIAQAVAMLAAPKRLVRGPDGRAAGVETVMN
jgi:hypothetical protein